MQTRSLWTRPTVKDGVPRRPMETTEASSKILPPPDAEATNTRSAARAMAATRRTQARSTRWFVQRAVSRLLEHDHSVAAKSGPGNPPEGEPPASRLSPDRSRSSKTRRRHLNQRESICDGTTHQKGMSNARPICRTTRRSVGKGATRSEGSTTPPLGFGYLPAKSAPVIVDTPAYLTDAFRSQGFSPSQRLDPTGALRLCFAPLPPIGFRPSELLPPGQPRRLSASCALLPFNRRLRRSFGPTLASQPRSSVTPSSTAPTSEP
jgi:hypothetical protein